MNVFLAAGLILVGAVVLFLAGTGLAVYAEEWRRHWRPRRKAARQARATARAAGVKTPTTKEQ